MPTPYLEKLSKEKNISIKKLEDYWDKAKELAKKSGHEEDYGYITGILKKMVNESEEVELLASFINKE